MHGGRMAFGDPRTIFYGKIVDYDPKTHSGRAELPAFTVVDTVTGLPTQSAQTPWFPVHTLGIGIQLSPLIGDSCMVVMTEGGSGPGIIVTTNYTDVTPGIDPDLQGGEFTFVQRQSLTRMKFFKDGKVVVDAQHDTHITIDKDGKISILGRQDANIIIDKDGNLKAQAHDGKTLDMPANGDTSISGPETAGNSIKLLANGDIQLKPGSGGHVTSGF